MIRPEDQRLLQPFLLPGERLLWAGRPRRGLDFGPADLLAVAIGLFFAALPFRDSDDRWFSAPASVDDIICFAVALYFLFRPFLDNARLRSNLLYAVSDRRVILLRTGWRRRLESLDLGYLPMLELDHDGADRGTLHFDLEGEGDRYFRVDYRPWSPSGSNRPGFEDIEHPQMVCNLIARESHRRRRDLLESAEVDPLFVR
jgi:hypothetical protein